MVKACVSFTEIGSLNPALCLELALVLARAAARRDVAAGIACCVTDDETAKFEALASPSDGIPEQK